MQEAPALNERKEQGESKGKKEDREEGGEVKNKKKPRKEKREKQSSPAFMIKWDRMNIHSKGRFLTQIVFQILGANAHHK